MMSLMVSSSSNGSSGPSPRMSSTSSPASARCSRALSWTRRSVAISEISRSTSAVSRSSGMAATAAGSSRARQMLRSSMIDSSGARWARDVHGAGAARGFGGARGWPQRDRRRAGAAAEGRDRRVHAFRRNGFQLRRAPDAGAAGRRGRRGVEQADERHLARQFVHAGAEAAGRSHRRLAQGGGVADLARQVGNGDIDFHLQRVFHLPAGQAAGDADAIQHHDRALRLLFAAGSASRRSVSRTAARVGSITSTRWSTRSSKSRYSGTGANGHVGDDEVVAGPQRIEQNLGGARRGVRLDRPAPLRRPARAGGPPPVAPRVRPAANRVRSGASSATRSPGPGCTFSRNAALPV